MQQKVHIDQWITHREQCLFLGIIPPTVGINSSKKLGKEQKTKLTPKKRGKVFS